MFEKQQRKIKRSAKLISVLSKYGFHDVLSRMNGGKQTEIPASQESLSSGTIYERIRMAIEEMGPTFVKLGQSFSNREDIIPAELALELQKLQDRVEVIEMDVPNILESELGIIVDEHFREIITQPIASASIAQVYKAFLKDGTPVILKVKKPNVQKMIEDDLMLVKDLVFLINNYFEIAKQLNLKNAVATFEKSLLEEVSLINEKNNILQFAFNYKNNSETYVPKVYDEYCNNNILCMEFVEGVKVTSKEELINNNIDPVKVSETGLRLFISQILDYGFFHADPHAGNILVLKDGRIVFIDFGAVGQIQPNDKEILENLILSFVSKNTYKIIRGLKKMAVSYDIPDDRKFESEVQGILDYVHGTSIKNIDAQEIINRMRNILKDNRLFMPDYFYLLFKGISLIEGVGRSINPELDVVKSLSPYSRKIMSRKLNPANLMNKGFNKVIDFANNVDEIPTELRSILQKLDDNKFTVTSEIKNIESTNHLIKSSIINLILAMVLCANIISTALLWIGKVGPQISDIFIFPIFGVVISAILIGILTLRLLRI